MMQEKTRDAILHLIRAVQNTEPFHEAGLHTLSTRIGLPDTWETAELQLVFGRGYFDGKKVLVYVNRVYDEMEVEEAVDCYMREQVPRWWSPAKKTAGPQKCPWCGGSGKKSTRVPGQTQLCGACNGEGWAL